jgi:hypothetical protein
VGSSLQLRYRSMHHGSVRIKVASSVILVLIVLGATSCIAASRCQAGEKELREKLVDAFDAVSRAESAGGDVSELVEELREALELLGTGDEMDLEMAESVLEGVLARAPAVAELGVASIHAQYVWLGVVLGLVAVSAVGVWRLGPRIVWSLWLRSKRSWRVRS